MRFAIYSRKSVYTGKGESIENQIEMCKQYILLNFADASETDISVYEDEGFSGKNTNRPRFQQMLKDVKQKKLDCIVCYKLDRISRNVNDFSSLIEELNQLDISFICIKENFNTANPTGKAMMYMASVFAQLERETIAERVRDNMLMLARTGRWLGGTTPMGFTSEKVSDLIIGGKTKTSYKLKWNTKEIYTVKRIYEKYLELQSLTGVSKYLIQQNIRTRAGNFYSILGIKEILQNPVYCIADQDARSYFVSHGSEVAFEDAECSCKLGLLSYNKRNYKKNHAPRQPMEKWIISIGKHKGIVTGKQWATVQNLLEAQKCDLPSSNTHNDYSLLSGLITCKKCGSRMFTKPRNSEHRLYDYICQNKMRAGRSLCDCSNLDGRQSDEIVCGYITQLISNDTNIVKPLIKLREALLTESSINPMDELNQRIDQLSHEMSNLIQTLSQDDPSPVFIKHVKERVNELDAAIEQLNSEKMKLESGLCMFSLPKQQISQTAAELSNLGELFNHLSVPEKRVLIRLLISKIDWDGENLHIFIYGK